MGRPLVAGLTIKAALVLGFAATFGVWLIAGFRVADRMAEVQREAGLVSERYIKAQDLIAVVRARVLIGSVFVRDALLDPDPTTTDGYRRQLDGAYGAADAALDGYVPILDSPTERARVSDLRLQLREFRTSALGVLSTDRRSWPTQARVLLNRHIMPTRDAIVRVSDEIQALNRSGLVAQQREIASIQQVTQRRVWEGLGLALALSLGIALVATAYVGRLETDIRLTTQDLQRLSASRVTAQEQERRVIARELHDEVGQVLMAIKLELAIAQRTIETWGLPGHLLETAQHITDGALTTVRDLSHLLHPAVLDDLGLTDALQWYVSGFERRHAVRVEFVHEYMDVRLAPEIELAAYRIVQEALTNVGKHARATRCRLYLSRSPETVLIMVNDDGVGFTPAPSDRNPVERGLGLIGIRERVAQLGGTVRIESAPGAGTSLSVELPARVRVDVPEPEEADAIADVSMTRRSEQFVG